jgi:hypothetical protein
MTASALKDGVTLKSVSSYRDYATQEAIFRDRYVDSWRPTKSVVWMGVRWYKRVGVATAAVPGTSNHGWGLAVDHASSPATITWLRNNAYRYGWSWEIQSEAWHIRYWAGDAIPQAVLDTQPSPKPQPSTPTWELDDMQYVADQGLVYLVGSGWHRLITGGTPAGARVDPISGLKHIIADLEASGRSVDITNEGN